MKYDKNYSGNKKIKEENVLKEKIIMALVVAMIAAVFSSCKGNTDDNATSSRPNTNGTSSVVSDNIPNGNDDGEYDDDSSGISNNDDVSSGNNSGGLGSDISSFVSSGKDMISSMLK